MPTKQLNGPFLFRALFALALACAAVQVLHDVEIRREAAELRAEGERAEAEGKLDRAADYLSRALVLCPGDTPALLDRARLLDRQGASSPDRGRALAAYQRVLARQPELDDVRRRVLQLEMERGRFSEAGSQVQRLLERAPADGGLYCLLAACLEAEGDHPEAAAAYESAIARAPAAPDGYVGLARLLSDRLGDAKQADAVLDRMIAANHGSAGAWLARGHYRAARGRLKDAAGDLARAADLAPGDADVLAAQADLARRRGRLDEAAAIWRRDLELHADDARAYLGLAAVERQAGRLGGAAEVLRRGTDTVPGRPDLLAALAEALIDKGEEVAATEVISRLHGDAAAEDSAGYLDGLLQLRQGRWEEAASAFAAVGASGRAPADLAARAEVALGRCHEEMGQSDLRLAAYRRAAELDPSSAPALLGLGSALLAQGETDAAVEQLRRLAQLPGPPEGTWVLLGRALVQRNRRLPAPARDWQEVEAAIDRASRLPSQAAEARVLRADVLLARGHPDQAFVVLEQAWEDYRGAPAPWVAMAELAMRRGEPSRAAALLRDAATRLGDGLDWRLAAIRFWAGHGSPEAAPALADLARNVECFSPTDQVRLLHALAEAHYQLGNLPAARQRVAEVLERRPGDLRARLLQVDLGLQAGAESTLGPALAELHRLEGDEGAGWRWGEAARLIRSAARGHKADLARARQLLGEAARRRPSWQRLPLLEAQLDEVQGEPALALEAYLWALKLGDYRPDVVTRTVQLLAAYGRYAEADRVVRRLEERMPLRRDQARVAAETAVRARNPARALELARQAVPAYVGDYREHLWLGSMLASLGRYGEAEEVYRRAVRVGEHTPDAWVALVSYLGQVGEHTEAEAALREAAKALPPEEVPLTLARCEEALNHYGRAEQEYARALASRPKDFLSLQRAAYFHLRLADGRRAEPLLRRLLDPAVAAPEESVAWARRELALVVAEGGDGARCREAVALLDANAAGGETVADRRARAFVAAAWPQGRAQALRTLEETLGAAAPTAEEQFRLARLYALAQDEAHAHECLRQLVAADGHNPAYLAEYVRLLARERKLADARRWLVRLEEVEPDSPRTRDLRAQVAPRPPR
jgi:tetratricopeptide (TPR) repeat protein